MFLSFMNLLFMRLMNKIDSSFFLGIWGKTKKMVATKCILYRTGFTAKTYPHTHHARMHTHTRTHF
uniref:Uncharacterized protein n=1 Tax=Anguilla anguilla TaxID=7936 RepID=A0A0E9T0P4_ANGAN